MGELSAPLYLSSLREMKPPLHFASLRENVYSTLCVFA